MSARARRRRSTFAARASSSRSFTPDASSGGTSTATAPSAARRHRDEVGEVELLLRVLRADPGERLPEEGRVGAVEAGVHLADRPLRVGRVPLLDDPRRAAAGVAHDAPVPARPLERHGRERERRAGAGAGPRRRAGASPSRAAGRRRTGSRPARRGRGARAARRAPRARCRAAPPGRRTGAARPGGTPRGPPRPPPPGARRRPRPGSRPRRGRASPAYQASGRPPTSWRTLARAGLHPGALPGGEDDGGERRAGACHDAGG